MVTTWDDEDVTVVGEHEVLAEIRRAQIRRATLPPPSPPLTLPPPTPPTATPAPARRQAAVQLDDAEWWDDDGSEGGRFIRRIGGIVVVLAVAAVVVVGLRSCGNDDAPTISLAPSGER